MVSVADKTILKQSTANRGVRIILAVHQKHLLSNLSSVFDTLHV